MNKLILPLKESVGVPVTPIVNVGDHVKRGQLIGKPDGLGANLHASVYGTIMEINDQAIVIDPDKEQPDEFVKIPDTNNNLDAIREAGIVGAGGAGFPAAAKYSHPIPEGHLFINAAECEPILEHNISRIITNAEQIIRGAEYIKEIVQAKDIHIAIKRRHTNAVALLQELIRTHDDISLELMWNRYPEGEERAVLRDSGLYKKADGENAVLKTTELPYAANAIVANVETVYRVARAIENREPVMDKDITVAGRLNGDNKMVLVHKNVPVGTLVKDVLSNFPDMADYGELIKGGPFTGHSTTLDSPITKVDGGIIATIPFPNLNGEKVGLLACACSATPERMKEIAKKMNADVTGIEWCKNAVVNPKTGTAKCKNPGICPGQAQTILKLRKDGAHTLLVGNCTDCTNTVMGVAPKLNMPVYHTTDFALRAVDMRIIRSILPENNE
ncbi:proline reductase-associated electron transfer protein PrdC [Limosilactobacillus reuteri]|uniref:proline reductase-associated electron transfer protein PrdC n=1 Tax=Limosilactobacillus reuteri TaxID=1598 RepID=UPI000A2D13F7|nr:proline reductase-associated electron transfer protein PrdC [Limosilactobacillus reuteri]OTA73481.1 proline reductase-associated electron transfer protein PrdC [Limosilactobacillus reuteri]OTA74239.1 proline reductase-associated electron transfer protein PrdC [Limosilactobacillus reuteri]OTA79989.1 proline reductase-associated electron transfer protein PrdC [Limosilactobacillus reuteri]